MSKKAILFDLDGTLLPMDQEKYIESYIKALTNRLAKAGYEPQLFVKALWSGIKEMMHNDGRAVNERVFWERFNTFYEHDAEKDAPVFEDFYRNDFQKLEALCGKSDIVPKVISTLKEKGFRLILATNPVFPLIAVESRLRWAGLSASDFEHITTYESANYCKPDPKYYEEILQKTGLSPDECIMVGNDTRDDMIAENVGIDVFLVTDCLINEKNYDISQYKNGNYEQLYKFAQEL